MAASHRSAVDRREAGSRGRSESQRDHGAIVVAVTVRLKPDTTDTTIRLKPGQHRHHGPAKAGHHVLTAFVRGVRLQADRDASHSIKRSSGQQLTMRSGGTPARRAWAIAVSA